MTTEAAESAATKEVVDTSTADLNTDLSTEQVAEETGAEEAPASLNTDGMSDDDFSAFMSEQLDGNHEQTEQAQTTEIAEDSDNESGEESTDELAEEEVADTVAQPLTFKVDGKEITVTDPEDIARLVERGLNSAADAKRTMPAEKLAQMLANNKLTDPAQLNHLIDIANGNPAALRKLLKDKGIDPYDLASKDGDSDEAVDYTPEDHSVSDGTIALNKVLDSLQDSEHFSTTADVVMEQWDATSRQEFMDNPKNFQILNNQVADGTYEAINNEMSKLELLGKLPQGKTQFEVYRLVGDQLFEQNLLPGQVAPAADKKVEPEAKPDQPTAEQRLQAAASKKRKRAVAPNRSAPPNQTTQQTSAPSDVYAGSDAEFIKATEALFNSM